MHKKVYIHSHVSFAFLKMARQNTLELTKWHSLQIIEVMFIIFDNSVTLNLVLETFRGCQCLKRG